MTIQTQSQKLAGAAFACIAVRNNGIPSKAYVTFAKKFPALIHTCGLAQSVAFAVAKKENEYMQDLTIVLAASGQHQVMSACELLAQVHEQPLSEYLRLSRNAMNAASWLKRYAEAASPDEVGENV